MGRPSRKQGLRVLVICGILLVVVGLLLVFDPSDSGSDNLALSSVFALALAQGLAAGRHFLYERRRE